MTKEKEVRHFDKKIFAEAVSGSDFIILYAPIVTLIVLSFNQVKNKVKMGRIHPEMV